MTVDGPDAPPNPNNFPPTPVPPPHDDDDDDDDEPEEEEDDEEEGTNEFTAFLSLACKSIL